MFPWLWMYGTFGLALTVVTCWGSVNRMMRCLEANEAGLKLAISYPEFPGNPSSRVNAVLLCLLEQQDLSAAEGA